MTNIYCYIKITNYVYGILFFNNIIQCVRSQLFMCFGKVHKMTGARINSHSVILKSKKASFGFELQQKQTSMYSKKNEVTPWT